MNHLLGSWCVAVLGSGPERELFRSGHLSTVVGLRLVDGRDVVVKVRTPTERLAACVKTQRIMFEAGFPCPEPLCDVVPFAEGLVATAETFVAGDQQLPRSGRNAALFAQPFARMLGLAPNANALPPLSPPLPWTGWDHAEGRLWPWPDDRNVDLNEVSGPEWVDDAGRRARRRLMAGHGTRRVGHGDWYAGNIRWSDDRLVVVHDWDSVIADTEPALVGFAAAVFPATCPGTEATVEETESFIASYVASVGRPFSADELELAWAAGVWLRAFDAKKQSAVREPVRSLTQREAAERLARAGA
jgi:hypothetical protein